LAASLQGRRSGWLRKAHPVGSPTDVGLIEQRIEDHKEVQVNRS
jgi:hypothetical protein